MAAFAAVGSLKHTVDDYLLSSSGIAALPSIRKSLEDVQDVNEFYQNILEHFNHISSKRLESFEGKIRDAAHKLEDVLEFHGLTYQDEGEIARVYEEAEEVHRDIVSFMERGKEVLAYIRESLLPVAKGEEEDGDDDYVSSDIDSSVEMVGLSNELTYIHDYLIKRMRPDDLCFFSFVGEVGSGRSVFGKAFFEDQQRCFQCSAWVTIGTRCENYKEVVICILDQVVGDGHELLPSDEDEKICNYLYKSLENRRYLIVLDDVPSVEVLDYLRRSFPDQSNGSLVFLTTNKEEVARSAQSLGTIRSCTINYETSHWQYLWGIAGSDAPEFHEAAKKIHKNCGGLRIVRAKTLLYLLKTEKTPEEWRKIAADEENPIFMVEDEISEILEIETELQSHKWDMDNGIDDLTFKLISSSIDFSPLVASIKKTIHPQRFFSKLEIISLFGMAGIGKSAFAMKMFQDKSILSHFDHCLWLSLGPKYTGDKILIDILAQIYPSIGKMLLEEDETLVRDLCKQLSQRRCLIVLDDLWSNDPLLHLKNLFPDIKGRALVTTRLGEVARLEEDIFYQMRLLDKEESWSLLRQKVFADGFCPPELEKLGRKIAENCEGLPLLLLKVADELLKVEKGSQHWKDAAFGKRSLVFKNAHDGIYKILFPSYKDLPQILKACFLYLGVFRKSYEISSSKVTSMLAAEGFLGPFFFYRKGFLGPFLHENKDFFVPEFLILLIGKSIVMAQQWGTNPHIKRCRLHCVFWHLCNTEAAKNEFFHAMDSYADCFVDSMKSQRRLCIRNSVLLGFKDVQDSMASVTSARSFLCVSPFLQYPVPISFGLRLLKVMHAHAIRLYEFPVEVVKLLHLRYLALTCNGKLPTSISKFRKLEHLIVSRYMITKSSSNSSPLPMEIWDMKELKHLQIMGGLLPNPDPIYGAGLPNLTALLDVSAESCTREVLEMIPNLKRLGIRIELAPNDEGNAFNYLNNISCLSVLESLRCAVVNPQFISEAVPPPAPVSMFPASLKRLSLSGLGYPWEHMSIIGDLRNLEELKLRSYAFRGPTWDINNLCDFEKLKSLLLEDTDLVQWEMPICQTLQRLSIKHCYKLREFPTFLPIDCFKKLEIVHCSPSTVAWAEQMRQKLESFHIEALLIR